MRACLSLGMPIPVSDTAKSSSTFRPHVERVPTFTQMRPSDVNFSELPIRFVSTCFNLTASPAIMPGTLSSMCVSTWSCFEAAVAENDWMVSRTVCRIWNGSFSNSILPASIFEKSSLSGVPIKMSVIPMIPFIGVRISWLMLAMNSLFARLAASARVFAALS